MHEDIKYCLNCGTQVSGNFCSNCGQSTATPAKLKMKHFGRSIVMSFGRLTPGFFTTAKGLLFCPWNVVRDHIHGKHIRYSPPITMVIQLLLYSSVIFTVIDASFGTNLVDFYGFNDGLMGIDDSKANSVVRLIDQSSILKIFFVAIPICMAVYLGYFRHGSRKYNFAEYLAAFVYMFAAVTIYDILICLLTLIPNLSFDTDFLIGGVASTLSIVVLVKAFPQTRWWKHIFLLLWSAVLMFILLGIMSYLLTLVKHSII